MGAGGGGLGATRARNDVSQYDDLVDEWWDPTGAFAMLHWLAATRGALVPPATRPGAVLVDVGCGGGLLAPHVTGLGYRHVGVDLTASGLRRAAAHGVVPVRAPAVALPLADATADVVCAGQVLEHVTDLSAAVGELCRILRPAGRLVLDTIAATPLARLLVVVVAERLPRGAPVGLHDPAMFVDRGALASECARHGVDLRLHGLRPSAGALARHLAGRPARRPAEAVVPTRSTRVLFAATGTKAAATGAGATAAAATKAGATGAAATGGATTRVAGP